MIMTIRPADSVEGKHGRVKTTLTTKDRVDGEHGRIKTAIRAKRLKRVDGEHGRIKTRGQLVDYAEESTGNTVELRCCPAHHRAGHEYPLRNSANNQR